LDALDREILSILSEDGRATMTQIASKVGLSLSACHRRFRELESTGAIRGFRAELDLEQLGAGFSALVFVTMSASHAGVVGEFEERVALIPEVLEAKRLFGDPDYQLTIATASQAAFLDLYDSRLLPLPGVQRMTSTLIMKTVVAARPPL
jgi:DNA-binding Lrp family transcriptional regulator